MPKSQRKKRRSKTKTGYFGVFKLTSGKYQAQISTGNGKIKHLGSSYVTIKQAAKAYDKEAIKLRKPLSKMNYPKKAPAGYTPIQQLLRSNNTVGYRCVYKSGKNFVARILIDSKRINLGTYDTAKEAAIAYDRAVLKTNKSTTLLNFPDDMVHNLDVEPKRKKQKRSSTGYKGVRKVPSGKFLARIGVGGKMKTIGTFDTAIQASLAYDQEVIKKGKKKSIKFPGRIIN